jgi:elongation factor P
MALTMLSYNEITPKKYIELDGEPYEVLTSWVFRKQQRKPVNQAKLRNLRTGGMLEYTFHQNDKVAEAAIETREAKFIYERNGEWWFCPPDKPSERFSVGEEAVGKEGKYLRANAIVNTLWFDDALIQVKIPIKVELTVTEAPPAVKGNTAQGASKQITLETGAVVLAPLFINEGDIIRVNTETGDYVERVEKK